MKKHILTILITISILNSDDILNIGDDFLQSLDEVSEIATKTKLNIDDTPSFVTVLQAKKLEKLGVNNVYEALAFIPGVELRREASGVMTTVFRGSATKGEVKFMIDGVEINNAYRSSYYYFLDLPIELISRIEVLRGTGGVLYGSGAINGVINIITKASQNDTNKIFISGGSYSYAKGGAIVSANNDKFKFSADAYYQRDDKEIQTTDQRTTDYSTGLNLKAYGFEFNARIKSSLIGMSYGIFGVIDTDKNMYDNKNQAIYTNLKYKLDISKTNEIDLVLNYGEYEQKIADQHASLGDLTSDYKEKTYYAKLELLNTSIQDNQLLIGLKYNNAKTDKTDLDGYPGKPNIITPNTKRNIYSAYVNDNYMLSKNINIVMGLRYDEYSDFGDNISPEFGIMYKLNNSLRFKLKYAKAFRAPSWTELYGLNGDNTLDAEKSQNIELGAIYKHSNNNRLAINIYHTIIDDAILKVGSKYTNENQLNLDGAELDYTYTSGRNLELNLIASYMDSTDKDNNRLEYIANFLTTASLIYTLDSGLNFGSVLRYTNAQDIDNKPIFNQTISYRLKDFNFSLIAQNLFNSQIIYYDTSHDKTNPIIDSQRIVLAKMSWEF